MLAMTLEYTSVCNTLFLPPSGTHHHLSLLSSVHFLFPRPQERNETMQPGQPAVGQSPAISHCSAALVEQDGTVFIVGPGYKELADVAQVSKEGDKTFYTNAQSGQKFEV